MFKSIRFSLIATAWLPLLAQNAATPAAMPGTVPKVHHLMGLDKVQHNAQGTVTVEKGEMRFASTKGDATVAISTIDDIYTGAEVTQSGGTVGTITKVALPYGGGRALSLLLRNKIDVLTITYHDANGGFHGFISTLPKAQGELLRTQLIAAGAHVTPTVDVQTQLQGKQDKPDPKPPEHAKEDSKTLPKLTGSAIRIEQIDAGDVLIPMEFRVAIYESLIQRILQSGAFQQVFRSGDRQADGVADLVTLHTKIDRFQEGSRTKREVTTIAGATKVDVSAMLTTKDGRVILDQDFAGKVRFFGDNLGATNDLAKHIAKLLRERF